MTDWLEAFAIVVTSQGRVEGAILSYFEPFCILKNKGALHQVSPLGSTRRAPGCRTPLAPVRGAPLRWRELL